MIRGGYILSPRIIQESDIYVAPPYVREIWNYLLREANSHSCKYSGHEIQRGQLFRSYDDIREGTKWFVGWRKMTYNENHMKKAMKFLRETGRITTKKELGGVLISICKYDYYQDPKNYERTTADPLEGTIEEPNENQTTPDNNKNNKNNKKEKNIDRLSFVSSDYFTIWKEWLSFKTRVNKLYKTTNGAENAYKELVEISGGSPATALLIVKQSIDKEWQGLFPLKKNGNSTTKKQLPHIQAIIDRAQNGIKNPNDETRRRVYENLLGHKLEDNGAMETTK